MYEYHAIFGGLASIIGLLCYAPYFRDIARGTTKPHPFSWGIWGLLNGIAFFAQSAAGGGEGAWLSAIVSVLCFVIAFIAFRRGERRIVALDWWCLGGALAGIVLWRLTNDPLAAIVLVTLTDGIAAIPTFRKGYLYPDEETALTYALGALSYLLTLFAFRTLDLTTALYPVFIIIANAALVAMLLYRRRKIKTT